MSGKAGRIVNFFNARDAALTAWEFNQLTKPDTTAGFEWDYGNEQVCVLSEGFIPTLIYPDGSQCGAAAEEVTSRFYLDDGQMGQLAWDPTLPVDGSEEQINFARILAHIVPARTNALGQLEIGLAGIIPGGDFRSFTDSNQGHSSQFHGYLAEPVVGRQKYWSDVLKVGFRLDEESENDLSGLSPLK